MHDTFIFDLDGTLLDTLGDLAAAVNYSLRTHGMPEHSLDDVRRFVGNGVRLLMERAVPGGAENPKFDDALATFRAYYLEHSLDTTRPYDGIPEVLRELKRRGKRLAVVSNKFQTATEELCRHFFPDTIEVAIGENEAAGIRKKPAPDTVQEALRRLGAPLSSPEGDTIVPSPDSKTIEAPSGAVGGAFTAVYVGDSDVDVQTAANSGLPCISVLWGFRDRDFLLQHGATAFAATPMDLLK